MSVIIQDGSWAVVTQKIVRKGEEIEVACKLVQYAPPQERPDGGRFFPRLGANAFCQVAVEHTRGGEPLKVKLGRNGVRVSFPDSCRKANWWDEKPTLVIKGESTKNMSTMEALDYCSRRFGAKIAVYVLQLLAESMGQIRQAA